MARKRRVNVYVDGFNLYYGSLRGTDHKWLDLGALFRRVLPEEEIHRIRYFSAKVSGRQDPGAPARQESYWRALRTDPLVSIHEGSFLSKDKSMPLAPAPTSGEAPGLLYLRNGGKRFAWVTKTEEKGSDVNLATYLLLDAFDHDCDAAVVVSNDSDLCEPIAVVRRRHMTVGLICPHKKVSQRLGQVASWQIKLFRSHVGESQFPATMSDAKGTFSRPPSW